MNNLLDIKVLICTILTMKVNNPSIKNREIDKNLMKLQFYS